jgi:hypothetical protein
VPVEVARPAARRGVWFWIKEICLLPFRLLGLFLVLGVLLGGLGMWLIPDVAASQDVDMTLLVLRILDDEGPVRPFYRLNYQDAILDRILVLAPGVPAPGAGEPELRRKDLRFSDAVVDVQTSRTTDGGHAYQVRFASGKSQQLTTTTSHTRIPHEELAAARRAVCQLYPPSNPTQWSAVLAWGESLFVTSWMQMYDPDIVPHDRFGAPGGTEDERLWCVWQVLRSGGAPEDDLFHLPDLFREAFPDPQDQEAAWAWAGTLHGRLEQAFLSRRDDYKAADDHPTGRVARLHNYRLLERVLPPDNEWTRLWLLQQYVGLSPAARESARNRWLGYFPTSRHEQVQELGTSLAEQRRARGDALPNAPDILPVLCVVERLTGTDPDGPVCCAARKRLPGRQLTAQTLQLAYPNDDIFYLLAAGDPLSLYPFFQHTDVFGFVIAIVVLVLAFLMGLGVQTALRWFAVPLLLGKKTRPLWDKHQEGRGGELWWLSAVGIVLLAGAGCLTVPFGMSELIAVQIGSWQQLFFGSLMATAVGGTLIAIVRRLATLFLIFFGVDLETTWADEILGILGGSFVLYHFGNDLLAIAVFVLSDFVPALLLVLYHRLRHGAGTQPKAAHA